MRAIARRLERIEAAQGRLAKESNRIDRTVYSPAEARELDALMAKAVRRPDGRLDLSVYTDDELATLRRLIAFGTKRAAPARTTQTG